MLLQITLTVAEAKHIIARAVYILPEVRHAHEFGKILLKGGTTVSIIAREINGRGLGICGRISPRGTKGPLDMNLGLPHSVIIEGGKVTDVDDRFEEAVLSLGKGDVLIISANAIDCEGNTAMMAGSPLGGEPGRVLGALGVEGFQVVIPAGLEKLIPGSIYDAIDACGRKKIDISFGMAVGLIPIRGKLVTEKEALEILADVKCTVIGKGGINGAEGSTTMIVEGRKKDLRLIYKIIRDVKSSVRSSYKELADECLPGCRGCEEDLACIYSKKTLSLLRGDGDD